MFRRRRRGVQGEIYGEKTGQSRHKCLCSIYVRHVRVTVISERLFITGPGRLCYGMSTHNRSDANSMDARSTR